MPVVFNNPEHLHTVPTNVGDITLVQVARKNLPRGLKRPYEYILSIKKTKKLIDEFKKYFKELDVAFQCAGAWTKGVSKGVRFDVFVLGRSPSNDKVWNDGKWEVQVGVSKDKWVEVCNYIQDKLIKYLGEDATIYAEEWEAIRGEFQARFETYIAYKELV